MTFVLEQFSTASLVQLYSRGRLVPFIGSGMSSASCESWPVLLRRLEERAGLAPRSDDENLVQRAFAALQVLREDGIAVASALGALLYREMDGEPGEDAAKSLARLHWPLVCTTNYDDVYLGARLMNLLKDAGNEKSISDYRPRVLGRSEADCQELLEQLTFPTSETYWAIQGMLAPRNRPLQELIGSSRIDRLAEELVVGHAEYRRVTHRAPHFRRTFADLFRSRSLLFLGSGLGEHYFLSLFDEIVELTGSPPLPHFALVEEGRVDAEFLRRRYHILCNFYPKGQHMAVPAFLSDLERAVLADRSRPVRWGFGVGGSEIDSKDRERFTCLRSAFPRPNGASDEAFAISCGRGRLASSDDKVIPRGRPLFSKAGLGMVGVERDFPAKRRWHGDWLVTAPSLPGVWGVVARELLDEHSPRSADARSPDAIRIAFHQLLDEMAKRGVRTVHTQLLASGGGRVFNPWIALGQMAVAYGEFVRAAPRDTPRDLRVNVYIVDSGILALLEGGWFNLARFLEGEPITLRIESVDRTHGVSSHFVIASPVQTIASIVPRAVSFARIAARPSPRLKASPKRFDEVGGQTLRDFGLVNGSTLVVDYRPESPSS